jgi:hypothetical protein
MTLDIQLSARAEKRLRERAKASGLDLAEYVRKIVEEEATQPTLDEILAPVRDDFARSGMTEEGILQFGSDLVNKVRGEKPAKGR